MKRIIALISLFTLLILLSTSCGGFTTTDDADLQTRVAAMLTTFPTGTWQAPVTTATNPLPTLGHTNTPTPTETATSTVETSGTPETDTTSGGVTATAGTPQPTPTITNTPWPEPTYPANDPHLSLGSAAWTDNMDTDANWSTGANEFTDMTFSNGEMVFTGLTTKYGWRLASVSSVGDVYIEMSAFMPVCTGGDTYGIYFRSPDFETGNRGYLFGITCEGDYYLRRWDARENPPTGSMTTLVSPRPNSAILIGANQINRLGVRLEGTNIRMYVNGIMVHEIADDAFTEGYFGLFIRAAVTDNLSVHVGQMAYWSIGD
jgi:hypothetical protein